LRAGKVEVGFRWPDDGSTGHLAYFDVAAFKNPSRPCLWRSLWYFAIG
jgi:demethoxyubiquinone hydroxylase (CLK1/Coq7/Cat5 family)